MINLKRSDVVERFLANNENFCGRKVTAKEADNLVVEVLEAIRNTINEEKKNINGSNHKIPLRLQLTGFASFELRKTKETTKKGIDGKTYFYPSYHRLVIRPTGLFKDLVES